MGYHSARHAPWFDDWQVGAIMAFQAGLWKSGYNWGGMFVEPQPDWFFKRVPYSTSLLRSSWLFSIHSFQLPYASDETPISMTSLVMPYALLGVGLVVAALQFLAEKTIETINERTGAKNIDGIN